MSRRSIAASLLCVLLPIRAFAADPTGLVTDRFQGRERIVYLPQRLPEAGQRALVVVLHGGLGNARLVVTSGPEHGLNLDMEADAHGFVVAYLDGTPVTRVLGPDRLGWNAGGGCCGQSAANNIDDVGYIRAAVADLSKRYGIHPKRVYGFGHSNGAMMIQRVVCEAGIYEAAVAVSGPLNLPVETCPAAMGARILAIHGEDDAVVPLAGGHEKSGFVNAEFRAEAQSETVLEHSGATYTLERVKGAGHPLVDIDAALAREGRPSAAKTAVQFFGLDR